MYVVEVFRRVKMRLANVYTAPTLNHVEATSAVLAAYSFAWFVLPFIKSIAVMRKARLLAFHRRYHVHEST